MSWIRKPGPARYAVAATLLLAILTIDASAGGDAESEEAGAAPAAAVAVTEFALPAGHYNLDTYEEAAGAPIASFQESPMLQGRGLPPVEERLPDNPLVMVPWEQIGQFGGTMRIQNFTAEMRRMGSAPFYETRPGPGVGREGKRLQAELDPGVMEWWEVSADGKTTTTRIRQGLKWSDGQPVTTDDLLYYWNDVLNNEDLTPMLPQAFLIRAPVALSVIDQNTFRLDFTTSFGTFPNAIDNFYLQPFYLLRPAHFSKQYHRDYAPEKELQDRMREEGYDLNNWSKYYLDMMGRFYPAGGLISSPVGTEVPNLFPWYPVQVEEGVAVQWERNPYYYKIDPEGNQLPYVDKIQMDLGGGNLENINLKIINGQIDYIAEGLPLENLPLYTENEESGGYKVMLLPYWRSFPNLAFFNYVAPDDPVLTDILQDLRFRQAVSLAIDRPEMNEALYLNLGEPIQYSPSPSSPWYREEFAQASAAYDPDKANALLDEMGITWEADKEFRTRPDGEPFKIDFTAVNYDPWRRDHEMLQQYWKEIGIDVQMRTVDGSSYWSLYGGQQLEATVNWSNEPEPTDRGQYSHPARLVPGWATWVSSGGVRGVEPPEWVQEVYEARDVMFSSADKQEQLAAGFKISEAQAKYLWYIGTVGRLPVPAIYSTRMGNISIAEQMDVHSYMVQEFAPQWFIKQ